MAELQDRKDILLKQLEPADEPPLLLHPGMAELYRNKVTDLAKALEDPESRSEATETLRGLIEAIVVTPDQGELRIELKGNLAVILGAAQNATRSPETGDLSLQVVMVVAPPRAREPFAAVHGPGMLRDPCGEVEAHGIEREHRHSLTDQAELIVVPMGSTRKYTEVLENLYPPELGPLAQLHEVSRRRSRRVSDRQQKMLVFLPRKRLRLRPQQAS